MRQRKVHLLRVAISDRMGRFEGALRKDEPLPSQLTGTTVKCDVAARRRNATPAPPPGSHSAHPPSYPANHTHLYLENEIG